MELSFLSTCRVRGMPAPAPGSPSRRPRPRPPDPGTPVPGMDGSCAAPLLRPQAAERPAGAKRPARRPRSEVICARTEGGPVCTRAPQLRHGILDAAKALNFPNRLIEVELGPRSPVAFRAEKVFPCRMQLVLKSSLGVLAPREATFEPGV
jgi:hypothetical protein